MSYTPLANIILSGDPRGITATAGDNDTSLATTAFVQGELAGYLPLSGGTMTSDITLGSGVDINFNDTSSGLQWSDVRIDRVAADVIQLASGDQIRVQQDPVNDNDLARKSYVDAVVTGLDVKESVRAATTANITLSGTQTIDGVSLIAGDRVLVKNQTTAADNGIYVVAAGAWSRAGDADNSPAGEVTSGMFTFVEEGTLHADQGWILTTNDPITLGVTALAFTQFSSATIVSTLDSLTDVDTTGVVDGALLRYESSGTVWNDTSALLFSDTNQLQILSDGSTGGLVLGAAGDVNLYRSAANQLRTDDGFTVNGNASIASDGNFSSSAGGFTTSFSLGHFTVSTATAATTPSFRARVSGDTEYRYAVQAGGTILWGAGGASAPDVSLARTGANILAMGSGDKLQQNAAPTVGDDLTNKTYVDAAVSGQTLDGLTDVDTTGVVDGALLRYEATGTVWNDTAALLFTDANQLQILSDASTGGLVMGAAGDVNLYRSAANVLSTDDGFTAATVTSAGDVIAQNGQAAQVIIGNEGPGAEAAIVFGSGADVNLYRSAANVLKTDDALDVAGRLIAEAGQRVAISSTKTANYTVALATDYIVRVDSSGGGFTVALPAGHSAGDTVLIKDVAGAAGTNNVIVDPNAAETIDGAATFSLTVNYQAVTVVSDGTNWVVV